MVKDLTTGSPTRAIVTFAVPMIFGNLFQQLYNVVDSIIVGQYLGKNALAAVGSSFAVMVFITSIILGLCMGTSVMFSQFFGAKRIPELKTGVTTSFVFIGAVTLGLMALSLLFTPSIITFMNIPGELAADTHSYLTIIFWGMGFTFLYNWGSGLLRALGNSKVPLYILIFCAVLNVALDLLFILPMKMGVAGAALATILSQGCSAVLCLVYAFGKIEFLHFTKEELRFDREIFAITVSYSVMTSIQQSIMNFGILLIQGLVNSFGTATMAAYAAAVKIDSFAYMPVQDFGNAFATYVAQNRGAGKGQRIQKGIRSAALLIVGFCAVVSTAVILGSDLLMTIFIKPTETEIIAIGSGYLHIVAAFYCCIGFLFMYYGLYRGLGDMKMSIVLTVISLGVRVVLAYWLAPKPAFGLHAIWWAIPVGWILADLTGLGYYMVRYRKELAPQQSNTLETIQQIP